MQLVVLLIQTVFDGVQVLFINVNNTTRCVTSNLGHFVGFCVRHAPMMPVPSLVLVCVLWEPRMLVPSTAGRSSCTAVWSSLLGRNVRNLKDCMQIIQITCLKYHMGLGFFIQQHKPLSTLRTVNLLVSSVDIHEALILITLQLLLSQGSQSHPQFSTRQVCFTLLTRGEKKKPVVEPDAGMMRLFSLSKKMNFGLASTKLRNKWKKRGNTRISVTLRRVHVTIIIIIVENSYYIFWVCVWILNYPADKAVAP